MRSISLLLLVTVAALGECRDGRLNSRYKRDLLVRSKRRWVLSTIELQEELKVDYPHQISTLFNDKTLGKRYAFQISGEGVDDGLFTINETSGAVFAHRPVDREKKSMYHVKFDVWDKETGQKIDSELAFDVEIKDVNDNPPQFIGAPETVKVQENWPEGYLPVILEVRDIDDENRDSSKVTISVISQDPEEPKIEAIQLNNRKIQLSLKGCFDYDKVKQHKVTIEAKDHGTPALSSTTVVTLNILDSNSHPPMFKERQYQAEALEMTIQKDVLRVVVEDKDAPNTAGWEADYFFISGNEEKLFELCTDPKTNEGVLSVIKEKNYDVTTLVQLQIGVKNNASLYVCKNGKLSQDTHPDSVNITIKMIDTNDPPEFEKQSATVYHREEAEPGKVLFTPKVHDVDSENLRFELVEDLADWVSVDEKTGQITTTKKMDRESPFVDANGVYQVVIAAIDDGEPPATSTCIISIHLQDINDHTPKLVNNSIIMCGNRVNKVTVSVEDLDADPYSGPFTFSLEDDETLKQLWKLDPAYGEQVSLVSLRSLPYGNYSVPLVMQDKQNALGRETLEVVVCDCGEKDVCRGKLPLSSAVGGAGIGLIFAGLLLFLTLLFACTCREKPFQILDDEGNQTLKAYHEEGGAAECQNDPTLMTLMNHRSLIGDFRQDYVKQAFQDAPDFTSGMEESNTGRTMVKSNISSLSLRHPRDLRRGNGGHSTHMSRTMDQKQNYYGNSSFNQGAVWSDQRTAGLMERGNSSFNQGAVWSDQHTAGLMERVNSSFNQGAVWSDQRTAGLMERANLHQQLKDQIDRKTLDIHDTFWPVHQPFIYAFEGEGSIGTSLEKLSVSNLGDDFQFLDDLGPKFKIFGDICHRTVQAKDIQF
ncbi:cadherin-like protein 26 [Odontesthes bonariensis]|uniref:cadherin-like protein 26 n=1 Tax=Odontesthes bonariensis TaxID=219752 RepID=UPI003F58DA92